MLQRETRPVNAEAPPAASRIAVCLDALMKAIDHIA